MSAPHEDAQAAAEVTRDAETPAGTEGGREDLRALLPQIRRAISDPGAVTPREADESVSNWSARAVIAAVVQPEIDRLTGRIPYREGETEEQYLERQVARWRSETYQARRMATAAEKRAETAEAELVRRIEHDERMTELAADHVAEYAQRAAEAEEWAGQLYTAWWSARIGRAKARAEIELLRASTIPSDVEIVRRLTRSYARLVTAERDSARQQAERAETTIGRVRSTLADIKTAIDTEMSDDESGLVRSYEILTAALDQGHDDLPAVREFAAKLDPRERRCICHPAKKPAYSCQVHGRAATRDQPEESPRG